jgi:hypothetical protein
VDSSVENARFYGDQLVESESCQEDAGSECCCADRLELSWRIKASGATPETNQAITRATDFTRWLATSLEVVARALLFDTAECETTRGLRVSALMGMLIAGDALRLCQMKMGP